MSYNLVYYCLTWAKAKEHGWLNPDPQTHPEWVMDIEFALILGALEVDLVTHGCATMGATRSGFNEWDWPTRAQWEDGLRYRIEGLDSLPTGTDDDIAALKAFLAAGNIGMGTVTASQEFSDYGQTPEPAGVNQEVFCSYESTGAGHAFTLIGYDDNKTWQDDQGKTHSGAFLGVNSWGQGWGVSVPEIGTRGCVWFSYEFVRDSLGSVIYINNRPETEIKAMAVIEYDHPDAAQISGELQSDWAYYPGRPEEPRWKVTCGPSGVYKHVRTEMVMDITEPWEMGARSFWLRVRTADFMTGDEPQLGLIRNFSIELPGAPEPWICPDTPARTVPLGDMVDPDFLWLNVGLLQDEGALKDGVGVDYTQQCWGDFAGDGSQIGVVHGMDLVNGEFPGRTYLLLPQEDGSVRMEEVTTTELSSRAVCGDLNNDGALELLTAPIFDEGSLEAWKYSSHDEKFMPLELTLPDVYVGDGDMALIDFNNDGRLDLATYPRQGEDEDPIPFRLWLQLSDGRFTDSGIRLSCKNYQYNPSMAWADLDNDGWLDVALSATIQFYNEYYDEYYEDAGVVFLRNTGGGGLEEYGRGEEYDMPEGNMAFGDANNDGLPDLALSGVNRLYINRGGGVFEGSTFGVSLWSGSWVGWADMDNDGLSDLIYCGDQGGVRYYYNAVALNQGDETFSLAVANLPGFWQGAMAPVDLDCDGDADLVGAGWIEEFGPWDTRERTIRVFRNRTAQAAGYGRDNQPPALPTGLVASRDGQRLTLNWQAPSDDITPAGGMQYNVRIDTFPGWSNFVSGLSASGLVANRPGGTSGRRARLHRRQHARHGFLLQRSGGRWRRGSVALVRSTAGDHRWFGRRMRHQPRWFGQRGRPGDVLPDGRRPAGARDFTGGRQRRWLGYPA